MQTNRVYIRVSLVCMLCDTFVASDRDLYNTVVLNAIYLGRLSAKYNRPCTGREGV